LGYPKGGFDSFLEKLVRNIRKLKGEIRYREIVKEIVKHKNGFSVKTNKGIYEYDKVICTLPSTLFVRMVKGLPHKYVDKLLSLKGIGAVNLVLELDKPFMDGYWLSVNDMDLPFLCIVEQTNYIEKKYYSGNHIIYIGNYLNQDHEYFGLTAKQLLTRYTAGLKKINSKFDKSWVNSLKVFKAGFAQPLVEKGYLKKVPDLVTPIHGLYLANIEQVYPWDRGTNYSVELGRKVAELTQE
jgi:protoporphyrinogen oxidase